MQLTPSVSLVDGTTLEDAAADTMVVAPPPGRPRPRLPLRGITPGLRAALSLLAEGRSSLTTLIAEAMRTDGFAGLARFKQYLGALGQCSLLRHHLMAGEEPFASLRPVSF